MSRVSLGIFYLLGEFLWDFLNLFGKLRASLGIFGFLSCNSLASWAVSRFKLVVNSIQINSFFVELNQWAHFHRENSHNLRGALFDISGIVLNS